MLALSFSQLSNKWKYKFFLLREIVMFCCFVRREGGKWLKFSGYWMLKKWKINENLLRPRGCSNWVINSVKCLNFFGSLGKQHVFRVLLFESLFHSNCAASAWKYFFSILTLNEEFFFNFLDRDHFSRMKVPSINKNLIKICVLYEKNADEFIILKYLSRARLDGKFFLRPANPLIIFPTFVA